MVVTQQGRTGRGLFRADEPRAASPTCSEGRRHSTVPKLPIPAGFDRTMATGIAIPPRAAARVEGVRAMSPTNWPSAKRTGPELLNTQHLHDRPRSTWVLTSCASHIPPWVSRRCVIVVAVRVTHQRLRAGRAAVQILRSHPGPPCTQPPSVATEPARGPCAAEPIQPRQSSSAA